MERPVVDKANLKGRFDIRLEWMLSRLGSDSVAAADEVPDPYSETNGVTKSLFPRWTAMPKIRDICDVIRCEQDALAAETRIANCSPYVAVNDLKEVLMNPSTLRSKHPATCRELPGSKGSAFIVTCPSLDSTVLWVGTVNDKYRDDYCIFLNLAYGLQATRIPRPFDVDHLYNRARAEAYKLQFLRVALVAHAVNRSHGAGPEKDATINEALRDTQGRPKLMDEIASMKYWGFLPPLRNDPRDSEVSAYATFAAARLGLDPKVVRESVLYLRRKASKPWAAKA